MSNSKEISDWFARQYLDAVALAGLEGGERFKKFTGAFPAAAGVPPELTPETTQQFPMCGRRRMSHFLRLRMQVPLGSAGYECLVMSARVGHIAAIYAYAYWRRGRSPGADPEYVCVAPAYTSRDGEYRDRFIAGDKFLAGFAGLAKALAPVEDAIAKMLASGELELDAAAYPADSADDLVERVGQGRLPLQAFAVALGFGLYETRSESTAPHTSPASAEMMRTIAKANPSLAEACVVVHQTTLFRMRFSRVGADSMSVACGQKLVPLFAREVTDASDFNLGAWRELALTRLAGDLVINFISPSFAIYNQWTYVEGANASLFDNAAMRERYRRGIAVAEAARSMRAARRALEAEPALQNWRTEELSARVYEDLEYAQSFALMSPVAMLHTMEHVGRALGSVSAFIRRSDQLFPAWTETFDDYELVAKLTFELCYAAHCLHAKLGVAHTDLHINNVTLYSWGQSARVVRQTPLEFEPYYDDPIVAYVAGPRGEADTYVFSASGLSACIIDYSRAILGPAFRPRLEAGRDARYATNFYRDQVNRALRTLHHYAAGYVEKHQEAIKAAIIANFEAVFPVLCAVDFIAIGRALGELFRTGSEQQAGDRRPFEVCREASRLADRLRNHGQEQLLSGLQDLVAAYGRSAPNSLDGRPEARTRLLERALPGPATFAKLFGEWAFPRWAAEAKTERRAAQLVDAYNFNNALRYSGEDYARFPPWARVAEIERHLGALKMTELFERGVEPFLDALQPNLRVELIAERARAEQESLDGEPVATNSSWIDE